MPTERSRKVSACSRLRGCFNPARIQAELKFLFFHPAPCCGHGVSRAGAGHTPPSWVGLDKGTGHHKASAVGGRGGFPSQSPCCSRFPFPPPALPRLSLPQAVSLTPLGGKLGEKGLGLGTAPRGAALGERGSERRQHKEGKLCFQSLTEASFAHGTGREHPIKTARHTHAQRQRLRPHPRASVPARSHPTGGLQAAGEGEARSGAGRGTPGCPRRSPLRGSSREGEGKKRHPVAPGRPPALGEPCGTERAACAAAACRGAARRALTPCEPQRLDGGPGGDVRLRRGQEPRGSAPRHTEHAGEAGQGGRSPRSSCPPPQASPPCACGAAGTAGVGAVTRSSRWQPEPGPLEARRPAEADLFACLPAFLLPHFFPMTSA